MNKRLLLINPWIHDFTAYDLWIQPLGLLYLAGVLEENGIAVDYVNCLAARYRIKEDGRAHFAKRPLPSPQALRDVPRIYGRYGIAREDFRRRLLQSARPEAVLVTSGMTYWYPGVQETIREVRAIFPHTKIFLGGIYATLMPEHARQYSGADVVISEPAENTIVPLLTGKPSGRRYATIDDYPYPAWHLTGENRYRILMTSRGCPYRCTFCASDILNEKKFIQRNVASVWRELTQFYQQGIRHFVFYDDALLIRHKNHLEPLLSRVIAKNLKAAFHTPNGLNAREVDARLAELMYGAGFRTIRLSLESTDPVIQKHQGNSKVNNNLFQRAVQNLHGAGYKAGDLECYLIMGLPGQTYRTVWNSLDFVADLGVIARLATFSPIPGTPEALEAQRWIGENFLREPLLQNHSYFPLRNAGMTPDQLQRIKLHCNDNNDRIRKLRTAFDRQTTTVSNPEIAVAVDLHD